MPRVLLIMPTTTYRAEPFLEAARRLGAEVRIASDRCGTLAEGSPGAARGALPIRFDEPDAAVAAIVLAARETPFDALVPVDDVSTVVAARAAHALGLAQNPLEATLAARDKRRLRAALAAARLPGPRHRVLPLGADPRTAAREVSYPVVLKPAALSASQGVIRANDERQFTAAFGRIRGLLRSPEIALRRDPALECILVEDFIPGPEVALEGLLRGGALRVLAVFDKPDPLDGPFFEETIYVTPSRHPPELVAAIERAASDAARAMGLVEGPVHAELRLPETGPVVLEVAARSIGGLCSRVLRFGAGVSLEELILLHALGREAALERERRPAGVMMIPIPGAGLYRGAHGLDEARAVPGVAEVAMTQALDTEVVPLPLGSCYLGFIFARAETPGDVEAALREAHRRIRLDIVPTLPRA